MRQSSNRRLRNIRQKPIHITHRAIPLHDNSPRRCHRVQPRREPSRDRRRRVLALTPLRKVEETPIAPVTGGCEEDDQQERAVYARSVEDVCQEEQED